MKISILLAVSLLVSSLPAVTLADSATSSANLENSRNFLKADLLSVINSEEADKFLSDPRLFVDESVVIKGITGKGFDYFSPSFGLKSTQALKDGLAYRSRNWQMFKKARKEYGVDSYYILGILRLESYFGKHKPKRMVANSLYSIYVLDPDRRKFALRELKQFMVIAKDNNIDPFSVKGSVAGAFGIPQFIPTSFYHFAIDGDYDGQIDLFNDADAIMSVARYLDENGWGRTEAEKRRAIYAYNHDQGYVNAVMAFAKSIENEVDKSLRKR